MNNKITVDHSEVRPILLRVWYMQILFWVILTVVAFFSLTLWYGAAEWPHILHTILQSLIGVAITVPMHWIFRAIFKKSVPVLISITAVVVVVFSFVWSVLRLGTFILVTDEGSEVWADFGGWYFSGFFIFLCWTATYYSLHYYRMATEEKDRRIWLVEQARKQRVKLLRAEKIAVESRMQMLRYQLNPHFLFNTLNAVNALIVAKELTQARTTVEKLSQFLRYALKEDKRGWVSLASELEALELYLGIERIRFADRLSVEYDIEDSTLALQVPSLLLQPLVENSIKHAVNVREDGCKISVSASLVNNILSLSVSDDGPGITAMPDGEISSDQFQFSGVGVKNIVDRLENIYGEDASVKLHNKKNHGVSMFIKIPIKT